MEPGDRIVLYLTRVMRFAGVDPRHGRAVRGPDEDLARQAGQGRRLPVALCHRARARARRGRVAAGRGVVKDELEHIRKWPRRALEARLPGPAATVSDADADAAARPHARGRSARPDAGGTASAPRAAWRRARPRPALAAVAALGAAGRDVPALVREVRHRPRQRRALDQTTFSAFGALSFVEGGDLPRLRRRARAAVRARRAAARSTCPAATGT